LFQLRSIQIEARLTNSETLILPADKDSRNQVTANKESQKDMVQLGVSTSPEDGQADEPDSTDCGKDDREPGKDLFHKRRVGRKTTLVSQPSLGKKSGVEENGSEDASGDEERPQTVSADVGNVCDVGVDRLRRIATAMLVNLPF
jgi:hypothetical protein